MNWRIAVVAALGWTAVNAPAEPIVPVTVDWNRTFQTIDGFGASGAFQRITPLMQRPEEVRTEILDALFSRETGAGLSIVRNLIGDGSPLADGVPTIEPTSGRWQWTGDEGQVWLMHEAARRGVTRFVSTVWSPPAWMKDNGSVIGGSLSAAHEQDFADYLAAYVHGYRAHFGLAIDTVSIANEPSTDHPYSSCRWHGPQLRDFLKHHLAPTFAREGLATKVMIAEEEMWSEELVVDSLADPAAAARVDIVAAHAYLGEIHPLARTNAAGKTVWMSEVSHNRPNDPTIDDGIMWARKIHAFMTGANTSAFLYWWVVSPRDNGGALVIIDPEDQTRFTLNKRLFTIGNYARFVRPGWIRMAATAYPAPDIFVSAYREPDTGNFVLVAINAGAVPVTLRLTPEGFQPGELTPWITDAARNLVQAATVKSDALLLPARAVTTYAGKTPDRYPQAGPPPQPGASLWHPWPRFAR